MAAINDAYRTLHDPVSRAAYDKARSPEGARHSFAGSDEESEKSNAFDQALADLEANWRVAVGVFPDLERHRESLTRISRPLAFQFVVMMLEKRLFTDRQRIAEQLERDFLERYFGSDPQVVAFGRTLIFSGRRDAALALNKLVSVMGSAVPASALISKVRGDFGLGTDGSRSTAAATPRAATPSPDTQNPNANPAAVGFALILMAIVVGGMLWFKASNAPQEVVAPSRVVPSNVKFSEFERCKGSPEPAKCEELERKLALETPTQRAVRQSELERSRQAAMNQVQSGQSNGRPPKSEAPPRPNWEIQSEEPAARPRPQTAAAHSGPLADDPDQQSRTGYVAGQPRLAQGGLSTFTVDNTSGGGDAISRLYLNGSRPAVRTFFIRRGERFTATSLTPGSYVLRYRYIGSDTTYESDREFQLTEEETDGGTRYSQVRVTLYTVAGGNLRTRVVPKESF
jgi:hypothetical protein